MPLTRWLDLVIIVITYAGIAAGTLPRLWMSRATIALVGAAALIAERFTGRLRYSGSLLGDQLASIIAGGPAPPIASWLFGTYPSSRAIAISIAICAAITPAATAMMPAPTGRDISGEVQSR